jgi:ribonuclease R
MSPQIVEGVVQVTRKGTGYVVWPVGADGAKSTLEDIEVSTSNLHGAFNGDMVSCEVVGMQPRPQGKVLTIVKRSKTEFVATLKEAKGGWVAQPADVKVYRPFQISNPPADAAADTKVIVHLVHFDGTKDPVGEVVKVIGRAGEHRVEMNAIVLEQGFDINFPDAVQAEATQIERDHASIIATEAPKRADYRGTTTFTIDPKDAKDFDDALSVKALENGDYEIGIHIADATFFCRPGTAIDDEAIKRGTSVYLVDSTIPMLPHELSGNVCSLKQDEDRLTFSAVFRINSKAEVVERKFEKSIIRSDRRFTYEEAQDILDKQSGEYLTELNVLRDLARIMRKRREVEGAIDFGDNEVRFELDEKGVPTAVVRKVRIETNLLIEEFMLLANVEVAKFVSKIAEKVPEAGMVFLYRIHDTPKPDRIEELATFVKAIGYEFEKSKKNYTARDIASLLHQIEGKPEAHLIRTATLRSMAKAIYSTKNIGHFGLAFEYYTHFTSPIRRYPDMLVHRVLASHLDGHPLTKREFRNMEAMCIAASEREAKAVNAERESIKYKLVEFMLKKVGQEFDAVISGVTDWGLYVEEKLSSAEGLVRVRTIGQEFFNYKPKEYALVGERTKKKYALGDTVRVKLVAADLATRQLDFMLV